MVSRVRQCTTKGLIKPPHWLADNLHYEVIMGSQAYGVSTDSSDMDVYGWVIPPKEVVFPHLAGYIEGFDDNKSERFWQFQEHHVKDGPSKEYDFTIYSVVKYIALCKENNPNMIDSLFVPANCVLHITKIGQILRDNRREFLHKGSFHKLKGYAFAQMSKIDGKQNSKNPKRQASIDEFGYDVKFGYHLVRLMNQAEQILIEHDLDLQKSNEHLKAIRRGEVPLDDLKAWFVDKEKSLEALYVNSTLRYGPDEAFVKGLLLRCLEEHYGNLQNAVAVDKNYTDMGNKIRNTLKEFGV